MDASKKIFVVIENLVFDFELFIGGRGEKGRVDKLFRAINSLVIFQKVL